MGMVAGKGLIDIQNLPLEEYNQCTQQQISNLYFHKISINEYAI